MTETTDLFVPPAAEGLPPGALDSATDGASALDASARTPYGRNLLAHALVQLDRDGWLRPARAAAPSAPAARAAILREAADWFDRYDVDSARELRRMADEAEYVTTPCSFSACEPGGEPCTTHERLMAHAEGDHELCGPDCGTSPSRVAGEAQQPEAPVRLAAHQTCGVCKSGYPTGGSCGTCAFNARMAVVARQADTAGEQQ